MGPARLRRVQRTSESSRYVNKVLLYSFIAFPMRQRGFGVLQNSEHSWDLRKIGLFLRGGTLTRRNDIRMTPGTTVRWRSAPCVPPLYCHAIVAQIWSSLNKEGDMALPRVRRCSWTIGIAMCLNRFVLIDVCSVDILVACWRISTGFKGDSFRGTHLWEHFGRTDKAALIMCLNNPEGPARQLDASQHQDAWVKMHDSPLSRASFWLAITLTQIVSQNASKLPPRWGYLRDNWETKIVSQQFLSRGTKP